MNTSRDPRRDSAKRPASRSPEGNSIAKRPTVSSTSKSTTLPGVGSREIAPVAIMNSAANGNNHGPSALDMLTSFFDLVADNADLRRQLREAEIRLNRANREFEATKQHFDGFPAIREQKTNARVAAQENFKRVQAQMQEHTPQVNQLLGSLAPLLGHPATASTPDSDTRQDVAKLEDEVRRLEQELHSKALRTDLTALQSTIATQDIKLKTLNIRPDAASASSAPSEDLIELKDRVEGLENGQAETIETVDEFVDNKLQELEARLKEATDSTIKNSTSELKQALARVEEAQNQLKKTQADIADRLSKAEAIDTSKTLSELSEQRTLLSTVQNKVQNVESEQSMLRQTQSEGVERLSAALATDRNNVETKLSVLQGTLSSIQNNIQQVENAQKELKQTQTESMGRLSTLEAADASKAQSELSELKNTISDIQHELQNGERQAVGAPIPGLLPFQPLIPSDDADTATPQTSAQINQTLQADVEMLKGVTAQHTRRMDNLTTDEIVRQMVDEAGKMYPYPKDFQATCDTFRKENKRLSDVLERLVGDLDTMQGIMGHWDLGKTKAEIGQLVQQVGEHERAVGEGKEQFVKIAETVKQLQLDVTNLYDAVAKLGGG